MARTLILTALLALTSAPIIAFADAPPPPLDAGTDAGPSASSDGGCSVVPGASGAFALASVLALGAIWVARRKR